MIFLTIGTQEPFDRLVRAMDDWARANHATMFGQLGALKPDSYRPTDFAYAEFMDAAAYEAKLVAADVVVAHAGMGSIISALTHARPIIIVPRRASLGEHRNEHQLATADRFRTRPGIWVADDPADVPALLAPLLAGDATAGTIAPFADDGLIATLRDFIRGSGG